MATRFLTLQSHAKTPLHEQIYARFKGLIAQGQLAPGERVPSLRLLAVELGVARGTVEAAYDRLIGEGYLLARGPAGTFVAERPLRTDRSAKTAPRPGGRPAGRETRKAARPAKPSPAPDPFADLEHGTVPWLQMGLPAIDAFPRKLWSRLVARHARLPGSLARPPAAGHPALREALAAYLHRSRGIDAQARQVFIVPSYPAALGLVAQTLLAPGDAAWIESPGYPPTAMALERLGYRVRRVPVDESGIDVPAGRRRAGNARLAVVTPSHQSPTGVSMTLARRTALLEWAHERDAWVFEDDYDGEYRFRGHPLPALKSLDRLDCVVYAGTLSKVLYPGLRLSYLVVPESLVDTFETASRRTLHGGCPELLQAVAAEFIGQGHFARHIKRMRVLYARRRALLAAAFAEYACAGLRVRLREGGMHLLIDLPDETDDVALARRAQAAGFGLQPLSAWRNGAPGPRGFMVGFTNVTSAEEARDLVGRLMTAVDPRLPRRGPSRN